ncbi:hypothetical protein ILYODFUR_030022 [Ilyodon furcidens]|uniref:Uncharacterized protein n=1 Tax=Ilyodon furcidens TaxID=33524 RepID=A0ABV0UXT1_9TELE
MGPPSPSPPPCPVPCLCSEAVCCGSTNARVRRKACTSHGPNACQRRGRGYEGGDVCLSSGMGSLGGARCSVALGYFGVWPRVKDDLEQSEVDYLVGCKELMTVGNRLGFI